MVTQPISCGADSGHKLLCTLCRTFQPPAMGARFICYSAHLHQLDCSLQILIIYTPYFILHTTIYKFFLNTICCIPFQTKKITTKLLIIPLTFFSSAIVSPSSFINFYITVICFLSVLYKHFICPYNPLLVSPSYIFLTQFHYVHVKPF